MQQHLLSNSSATVYSNIKRCSLIHCSAKQKIMKNILESYKIEDDLSTQETGAIEVILKLKSGE